MRSGRRNPLTGVIHRRSLRGVIHPRISETHMDLNFWQAWLALFVPAVSIYVAIRVRP